VYAAPPARFGRACPGDQYHLEAPIGRLTGNPAMDEGAQPRRTLSVLLDDPAAAALSLRTHMQPPHLMQLLLILAQAAADTLHDRHKLPARI
jgi:hypothetical protein